MQREFYNDRQVSGLEKEDIFSIERCYPITEDPQHTTLTKRQKSPTK